MQQILQLLFFFHLFIMPCFTLTLVQDLSLEEKIGQLLMVHFQGDVVTPEAEILINEIKVGGIIYYNWSNGLHSPEQIKKLSSDLQKLALNNSHALPLFISADQEGGVVSRLNQGFTSFPGNRALGETKLPHLAHLTALAMGKEMRAVGINMNFAPVVDVNCNPRNPVIGLRAFSHLVEDVVTFAKEALEGFKQARVISTLKHFPGHGDVETDSHHDLPVVLKSLKELQQTELVPFAQLAAFADVIMTAHLLIPALDQENCATLSKNTLDYLKNTIGFQGIVITDSLVMEAVLKKCLTVDEAAIQALNAGCDLLLLGGKQLIGTSHHLEVTAADLKRIHHSLVTAVKSGRVSEQRVNEAVEKILRLKEKFLEFEDSGSFLSSSKTEHEQLAQQVAELALQVNKQNSQCFSLKEKNVQIIAPHLLKTLFDQCPLKIECKQDQIFYFSDLNPSIEESEAILWQTAKADVIVMCMYNAWKNPSQLDFVKRLSDMQKPLILLVMRDPQDATFFPQAELVITTFSPTIASIQAINNYLKQNDK